MKVTLADLKPSPVRYDVEAPDFRDGREFKSYAKALMQILEDAPDPLTTRSIHEALEAAGIEIRRDYTALALENPKIEERYGVPSKYFIRSRFVKDLKQRVGPGKPTDKTRPMRDWPLTIRG